MSPIKPPGWTEAEAVESSGPFAAAASIDDDLFAPIEFVVSTCVLMIAVTEMVRSSQPFCFPYRLFDFFANYHLSTKMEAMSIDSILNPESSNHNINPEENSSNPYSYSSQSIAFVPKKRRLSTSQEHLNDGFLDSFQQSTSSKGKQKEIVVDHGYPPIILKEAEIPSLWSKVRSPRLLQFSALLK